MGLPVFKTGDAAPGVAWWVRLPRVPAMEASNPRMTTAGRRPPSIERVLAAVRATTPYEDDAGPAVTALARAVVAAERARLRADATATPRSPDELAAEVGAAAMRPPMPASRR